MSDLIAVTFSPIADGAADSSSTSGSMDGLLGDLRSYLAPLVAQWTGQASDNYQAAQRKWDEGAREIHDVLVRIGTQLSAAHDRYSDAEDQNARRFA